MHVRVPDPQLVRGLATEHVGQHSARTAVLQPRSSLSLCEQAQQRKITVMYRRSQRAHSCSSGVACYQIAAWRQQTSQQALQMFLR